MIAALAVLPAALPAASANEVTEAQALVERCREGNRQWDILSDRILSVEEDSEVEARYGHRPIPLIKWRGYSAIGGPEIERARDEYFSEGLPPEVVEAEYRAAKKRERDIELAGEDWDRKVGLTDLRKQCDDNKIQTYAAREALGHVRLTNIRDATAVIALLREQMSVFDQLSEDWEVAAFMNASHFLIRADGRGEQ